MIRNVLWPLLILAGCAAGLVLLLGWYEARLVYFPTRDLERTPVDLGLAFEDVHLDTADGERISGWYLPAGASSKLTALFLHGNAGNISHRFEKLAVLRALGVDVLIIDYRGYGNSTGAPTERGIYLDVDAAYQYLIGFRGLDPLQVVLYGESLGSAVAVDLASRKPVGGLVLESVFSSGVDVGQEMFPFLPMRMLVRNRYETVSKIGSVRAPVLILHSRDDEFFGWHHPRRLYDAVTASKTLVELRGGHNDAFAISAREYVAALSAFFSQVVSGAMLTAR
jgi:hypothetical protein